MCLVLFQDRTHEVSTSCVYLGGGEDKTGIERETAREGKGEEDRPRQKTTRVVEVECQRGRRREERAGCHSVEGPGH